MSFPTLQINSAGSDTAASGAGPATAVTGTLAATHGNTTVNITDAVALGGVAVDGSAVLWISSSSGRQFSKITAISGTSGAWVVTVAVAYANTESGKTWAIGGKRATMAGSTALFNADWAGGWIVDVQTGETISTQIRFVGITPTTTTPAPLVTSTAYTTWGTQPLLQTATNSLAMFDVGTNGISFENLQFKSTAGTPATAFQAKSTSGQNQTYRNLIFDGFLMALDGANQAFWAFSNIVVDHCEFKNCTGTGASSACVLSIASAALTLSDCYFHDNKCVLICGNGNFCTVTGNVFANNNTTAAISAISMPGQGVTFKNNSVYNCGGSTNGFAAVAIGLGGGTTLANVHKHNIYYGCSGYAAVNTTYEGFISEYNAYGGNNGGGTGANLGTTFPASSTDVTLSANPYISTVTPDWGLNSAAGGGASCKRVAVGPPNASANAAGDLGAIPSGGGSAGGGGWVPRPYCLSGGFQ
jgi:hypothetical protein